jgi:hypothetical protein
MRAFLAILIALLAVPLPAQAKQTQRYVADYEAKWPVPLLPAPDTAAIQFTINAPVFGGRVIRLNPGDVEISILRGSQLQSSLVNGQTLQITPTGNGDLLVTIVGDIRTVNPGQVAKFKIDILKQNVTTLRLSRPQWGNADANNNFTALGSNGLTGGLFALDPQYVAFNDLGDLSLVVRNLELMGNVSPLSFDSFDAATIFDAPFNPGLPSFLLSPGTSSTDLGLMFDFGPEPDLGNFLVAQGQVVDPQGNILSAFIQGVQAVPAPDTLWLFAGGLAWIAGRAAWRQRTGR